MAELPNTVERGITASVGLLCSLLLFFIPYFDYLLMKIIYFAVLALTILELQKMLPQKLRFRNTYVALGLGTFISLIVFLVQYFPVLLSFFYSFNNFRFISYLVFMIIISNIVLKGNVENLFFSIFKVFFFLIYPGTLFSFMLSLFTLENYPILHVFTLLMTVYVFDGFSYIAGMVLRPAHRNLPSGMRQLSPRKTLTGYIGGTIIALYFLCIMKRFVPELFPFSWPYFLLFSAIVILSACTGDLFESALKRKLKIKNSGTLMFGRGGVLDSCDSLIFSSPTYYILYNLMSST